MGIPYIPSGQRRAVHGTHQSDRADPSRVHRQHRRASADQDSDVARVLRYKRPGVRHGKRGKWWSQVSFDASIGYVVLLLFVFFFLRPLRGPVR